jgi:hypothetical protein
LDAFNKVVRFDFTVFVKGDGELVTELFSFGLPEIAGIEATAF